MVSVDEYPLDEVECEVEDKEHRVMLYEWNHPHNLDRHTVEIWHSSSKQDVFDRTTEFSMLP